LEVLGASGRASSGKRRGRGLDVEHVRQLAFFQAQSELGDVSVCGVAEHRWRDDPPFTQLVDHVQRQLPLGLMAHLVGHPARRAAWIAVPGLGQEQPPIQRTRRLRRDRANRHADLAVAGLAQRAAVLPGDADRHLALFGKPGVVDHPRLGRDRLAHPHRQPLADRLPLPRRLIDELLQALLIAVLQAGGHRLDALALAIEHQPTQIHLAPAPLILAAHRLEQLRRELDKPPTHALKLLVRQPRHRLQPGLPRRRQRRSRDSPAKRNSFNNLTE
jgi:hypothetical protein